MGSARERGAGADRRHAADWTCRQRTPAVLRDPHRDADRPVALGAGAPRAEAAAAARRSLPVRSRPGRHLRGCGGGHDLQLQPAGRGDPRRLRVPLAIRPAVAARVPAPALGRRGGEYRPGRAGDGARPRRQALSPRTGRVPADRSGDRRARRERGSGPDQTHVPGCRRDDGAAPGHPGRHRRSLYHPVLRQSQEVRPTSHRHLPCAADCPRQVGVPLQLDQGHGPFLRHQPVSGGIVGHERRTRQPPRADRQHQAGAGDGGARVRGQARVLRHQRHLDLEQDRRPGDLQARRHRHRRSQLPQVPSLRAGAVRGAAVLRRSLSADGVLDVRRGARAHHQEGALRLPGAGHAGAASRSST